MRKLFLLLLFLLSGISFLMADEPILRIGVMSDLHNQQSLISGDVSSVKLRGTVTTVLNAIKAQEKLDMLVLNGDLTSDVTIPEANWQKVRELLVNSTRDIFPAGSPKPVIYCNGNHEYEVANCDALPKLYNAGDFYTTPMKQDVGVLAANECFYEPAPNGSSSPMNLLAAYHYVIKGFDCVVLNTGKHFFASAWDYQYSKESVQWVANKLTEIYAGDPNKTVFFFAHMPFADSNSISATNKGLKDCEATTLLKTTLAKHPNLIYIYGHDHGGDKAYTRTQTSQRVTQYDADGNVYVPSPAIDPTSFCVKNSKTAQYLGRTAATDDNMKTFVEEKAMTITPSANANMFNLVMVSGSAQNNVYCGSSGRFSGNSATTDLRLFKVDTNTNGNVAATQVTNGKIESGSSYLIVGLKAENSYALTNEGYNAGADFRLVGASVTVNGTSLTYTDVNTTDDYTAIWTIESKGSSATLASPSFFSAFAGSMRYYNNTIETGGSTVNDSKVAQALMIYVYNDSIVLQMKNYAQTGTINDVTIKAIPESYKVIRKVTNTGIIPQEMNQAITIPQTTTTTGYRLQVPETILGDRTTGTTGRTGKSFTLSSWVNIDKVTNVGDHKGCVIMGHGPQVHMNYNGSLVLCIDENRNLKIISGAGNTYAKVFSGSTIDLNTWTYLTLVYDDATHRVTVYKDGTLVGESGTQSTSLILFEDDPTIFFAGGMGFSGLCDEFEFYNKALTQSDILKAYLTPKDVEGLQAWYNFNTIDGGSMGSFLNKVTAGDKKDIKAVYYKYTGNNDGSGLTSGSVIEVAPTLVSGRTVISEDQQFILSAPQVEHGTLTFKVDNVAVNAESLVKINKSVEVTAVPTSGYKLVEIYVNGKVLDGNTFIMNADASVTAKFVAENAYQVSYTVRGEGTMTIANSEGTIIENKSYVVANTQLIITLTPSKNGIKLISLKKGAEDITSSVTNNQLTVTMPAENVVYTAAFASPYCKPASPRKDATSKRLNTITVSGATLKGVAVPFSNALNNDSQPDVYLDRTENVISTTKGDELTISWTLSSPISWMHYYVYIDYNQDEIFNQENELVSYTYYDANGEGPSTNSLGDPAQPDGSWSSAPKFTIPTSALSGKTRLRFKVDWNSKDPCGNAAPTNLIGTNNGTIIDYTIDVKAKESFVVNITNIEGATISLKKKDGTVVADGTLVEDGTELTATVTDTNPEDGKRFKNLLVNGSPFEGNKIKVTKKTNVSVELMTDWTMKCNITGKGIVKIIDESQHEYANGIASIPDNTYIVLNFIPESGYKLTDLATGGASVFGQVVSNSYDHGFMDGDYTYEVTFGSTTSIDSESMHTIALCYNAGKLFVDGMKEGDKLSIYDLAGNYVKTAEIAEVNVQDLANGCYLVKVTTINGSKTMKFVKR